jgi:FKBP-type peptidyl-prolyl cis-trans isomerase FkpA
MRRLLLLPLLFGVTSCDLNTFRRTPVEKSGFAAELHVDTTAMTQTASGLKYQDLVVGSGTEARPGNVVSAHYTGWLVDGTKFDSSHDRGTPYSFQLGERAVIDGWDEGLVGMKVGGKRKLVVPPGLGYGAEGSPPRIPPNATLVFDVELMDVR